MADANIDIAVRVKNEASAPLKQVKSDIGGLEQAANKVSALATGASLAAVAAVGVAAVGAAAYAKQAIAAASDLSESISKTNVIFEDAANTILEWSTTTAGAMGIAQNAALGAASTFATFGKAAGISGEDLAIFSTRLTGLAADLASFYNTSPEDAITAIGAALRGESEPIRAYGVLLDDATLRQQALKMGIVDSIDNALTPQQRALAATAAIFQQTSDAQGDFERTSSGLANQQRILAASLADVSAIIGTALLPAAGNLLTSLNALLNQAMPRIVDFANGQLAPAVQGIADAIDPDAIRANINEAIGGFEYWGNATIATYNDMLTATDMFVTGFYNGVNGIIGAINQGIVGLNQFDSAMRQLAAGAALLRGDVSTALSFSQPSIQIPQLPEVKRPADSYLTVHAIDPMQLQRWEDTTRAADTFSDAIRGVGASTEPANDGLYDILRSADLATDAMGKHGAAVKAAANEYDNLKSKVSGVLSSQLDVGVGVKASDLLPREDEINENARRLADIAQNGLNGQEWMDAFMLSAPETWAELMQKIADGADAKSAAAQILRDFEDGLQPDLIDKTKAKERVKRMLLGEQSMAALAEEIAQELATEMNIPLSQAMAAAGSALGVSTGAAGEAAAGATGETGAPDMTGAGQGAGATFAAGFAASVNGATLIAGVVTSMATADLEPLNSSGAMAGTQWGAGFVDNASGPILVASIIAKIAAELPRFKDSGGAAGTQWGAGFMGTVESGIAQPLITLLTTLVTPGVLAAIQAGNSQTTPP